MPSITNTATNDSIVSTQADTVVELPASIVSIATSPTASPRRSPTVRSVACNSQSCTDTFSTTATMWAHWRRVHQEDAIVRGVSIKRDTESGFFMCPCGKAFSRAKGLGRHGGRCLKFQQQRQAAMTAPGLAEDAVPALLPEVPATAPTTTPQAVSPQLEEIALRYYPSCRLLQCIHPGCSQLVYKDVRGHVAGHGFSLSPSDAASIESQYLGGVAAYFGDAVAAVAPPSIPFLPMLAGVACSQCGYLAISQKKMTDHHRDNGHTGQRGCSVHRFTRGCVARFVEVVPSPANPAVTGIEAMCRALMDAATNGEGDEEERPAIYDQLLLVLGIKTTADVDRCVMLSHFLGVGGEEDKDIIAQQLKLLFRSVKSTDLQVRKIFPGKVIKEHQQSSTVSNYVEVGAAFLVFVLKYHAGNAADMRTKLRTAVTQFKENPITRDAVAALLHELLSELTVWRHPVLYEQYIRACLFNDARKYLGTANVGPLCAKLLYLQKVGAMYRLSKSIGKAKVRMIARFKAIFSVDAMNAHSSVASIMNIARQVAATLIMRYRVVPLSLDKGDVQVDGVNLHLTEMQTAYAKIVAKCKELQDRLLFGAKKDVIIEDVDQNNSGRAAGQGIRCRQAEKQEGYSHHLLLKVVRDEGLRARMIDGGVTDSIVFKAAEVTSYLRLHEEFMTFFAAVIHISSGCPARGTELARYTITNDAVHRRVVYFFGNRVAFISTYNKTNSMTQTMKVPAYAHTNYFVAHCSLFARTVLRYPPH